MDNNQPKLTPNTLLQGGKYEIKKCLGQGSFGITYLAEHTILNRKVAIKEFFMKGLNSRSKDGSITEMSDGSLSYNYCLKFKKEAVNLSQLDHPNIVRVTDCFPENGTFYYVMDYIDGENLNDFIKTHRISEGEAVTIIKCVAEALTYMHEKQHMLHLDLKPGNIMIRKSDSHIYLIDFGLSKHYDKNGEPESSTAIGLGTAGYAPIEQANQSKNGEFRPTIDVYALGATLYKLLTGKTPPDASELVSQGRLIADNLQSAGISANVVDAVTSAMTPNVYERTQTVSEFVDILNNGAKEDGTIVDVEIDNPETRKPTAGRPTGTGNGQPNGNPDKEQKHPTTSSSWLKKYALVVCTIVAFVVGAGAWFLFNNNKQETPAEVSQVPALPTSVKNVAMVINKKQATYTGEVTYKDSTAIPHGKGEAKFADGKYYKGNFSNGKMNGDNAYFKMENGDIFRGTISNDVFSEGRYTDKKTGDYFEGKFDSKGLPRSGAWYNKRGTKVQDVGKGPQ